MSIAILPAHLKLTPKTVDLDEERRVIICVSAGRNDVTKAHVKIATSPMSSLNLSASTVVNNGGGALIAADGDLR